MSKVLIEIEIDQEVLDGFYAAVRTDPDPDWTDQEVALWSAETILKPFIARAILHVALEWQRTVLIKEAQAVVAEQRQTLEKIVDDAQKEREAALPEKLRPLVDAVDTVVTKRA